MIWWLAMQAAQPTPAAAAPIDFDLARVRPTQTRVTDRCEGGASGEIVVCGRRRSPEAVPSEEMERRYAATPAKAQLRLGGAATASAYVDAVAMPNGEISKRIMIGVKLPF